jgi:uncharacterized repeat protein (TIGR03803 family)
MTLQRPAFYHVFAALFLAVALASCAHAPGGALPQTLHQQVSSVKQPILHVVPLFFYPGGTLGTQPVPVLVGDPTTAMYGVTTQGGQYNYGTVYKLTPSNGSFKETVIHNFNIQNLADGAYPAAPLVQSNTTGKLFGTTEYGGKFGQGTVFEISAAGAFTQLHSFQGGTDGALPASILRIDTSGALYGTTLEGGCTQLVPNGSSSTEQPIYRFQGGSDGIYPWGGVTSIGSALFGTTYAGGSNVCGGGGCGTIYELQGSGFTYTFQTIHTFTNTDGAHPHSKLLAVSGTLYGTTLNGGLTNCANGCGTVFALTPGATTLNWSYDLAGGTDGDFPFTGLTILNSVLYGTTLNGGNTSLMCAGRIGCGTIFSIGINGTGFMAFDPFAQPADGNDPNGAVFVNRNAAAVYGSTVDGGDPTHTQPFVFKLQ